MKRERAEIEVGGDYTVLGSDRARPQQQKVGPAKKECGKARSGSGEARGGLENNWGPLPLLNQTVRKEGSAFRLNIQRERGPRLSMLIEREQRREKESAAKGVEGERERAVEGTSKVSQE